MDSGQPGGSEPLVRKRSESSSSIRERRVLADGRQASGTLRRPCSGVRQGEAGGVPVPPPLSLRTQAMSRAASGRVPVLSRDLLGCIFPNAVQRAS